MRLCSDAELKSLQIDISGRIKDNLEEHSKPGNSLEPVEVADMGVDVGCAKALQQLCQKSKITCPADYTVVDKIPSIIEIHKEVKIGVVTIVLEPTKSNVNLECQFKCLSTGPVHKANIEENNPGRYEISYTPSVLGQHELSNGQPVPGSPFTVAVYISPAQLVSPTKVWDGVMGPCCIAVNWWEKSLWLNTKETLLSGIMMGKDLEVLNAHNSC